MITYACFVPHSPLLIPQVGQENLTKLKETIESYDHIAGEIYAQKPDIILVISPHTKSHEGTFTINQAPEVSIDFKKFGDLVTNLKFNLDLSLGYQIKEAGETSLPIALVSQNALDYGAGVPIFMLTKNLPKIKILNIGYSNASRVEHLKFGEIIKEEINKSGKRVVVVASGDLSHRLHQDSPNGYSPRAQEFDQKFIALINQLPEKQKIDELVNLDKELIKSADPCGYRSLLILLGIIKNINFTPEQLSYQAPFGIGYLVENFKLN